MTCFFISRVVKILKLIDSCLYEIFLCYQYNKFYRNQFIAAWRLIHFTYKFVTDHLTLNSFKKYRPRIDDAENSHHTVIFGDCNGTCKIERGFSCSQILARKISIFLITFLLFFLTNLIPKNTK